jgi:carbon starvation protein
MFMAVAFGILIYRMNCPLWLMTVIMVPVIIYACWFGNQNKVISTYFSLSGNPVLEFYDTPEGTPINAENFETLKASGDEVLTKIENFEAFTNAQKALKNKNMENWRWVLVAYILLASVLPVWLLLQPRDYLASYFLYFAVIVGTIGMIFGGDRFTVSLPAFKSFVGANGDYLWPMLFITVACGALSGFHALVGSGTTSKQIRKEKDAILVGYGAMLIEGVVAVIAIGTIMISGSMLGDPMNTYATGFGQFAGILGIDPKIGKSLGLLAVNTFLLTSLDTATRLGRYLLQELFNMKVDRYTATVAVIVGAVGLLLVRTHNPQGAVIPAWAALWPMFGSANQLVGALVLLGVAVWVKRALKQRNDWLMYPMWFMLATTIAALALMIKTNLIDRMAAQQSPNWLLGGLSAVLAVLAILMVQQAFSALKKEQTGQTRQ